MHESPIPYADLSYKYFYVVIFYTPIIHMPIYEVNVLVRISDYSEKRGDISDEIPAFAGMTGCFQN